MSALKVLKDVVFGWAILLSYAGVVFFQTIYNAPKRLVNDRLISILYGMGAGAALISFGVSEIVLIPVSVSLAMGLELYGGYNK